MITTDSLYCENRLNLVGISNGYVLELFFCDLINILYIFAFQGIHPYHSLSYTSGDTATDSPVHVGRSGQLVKESPRKESLLSYLTGSFPSLHNLLEGTPQRSTNVPKSSSLTRTGRNNFIAIIFY